MCHMSHVSHESVHSDKPHLELSDVAAGDPGVQSVELPPVLVPLYAVNLKRENQLDI